MRNKSAAVSIAVFAFAGAAACMDGPTAPGLEPDGLRRSSSTSKGLLQCATSNSKTVVTVIGASGGTVDLAGSKMTVPAGAVLSSTVFKVTIPASQYVEVDITANDLEHFQFEKPVSVTIDYGRCGRSFTESLTAWYIAPVTKALLQNMRGTDDKSNHKVTFITDHLSGYSVGYEQPPDSTGNGN